MSTNIDVSKTQGKPRYPDYKTGDHPILDEKGKFRKGNKASPGYPKGKPHTFTIEIRSAFLAAFHHLEMGGVEGLVLWATSDPANQAKFYELLIKMLPKRMEVSGPDGDPIGVRTTGAMERLFNALADYAERNEPQGVIAVQQPEKGNGEATDG